jgi:stalled ribosome rescue protein Dom34
VAPQRGYRRGYAVAMLVGLEKDRAVLWKVFSNVVKLEKTVPLNGDRVDPKALYNFHESIVNALRPTFNEGVGSYVVASPARTDYSEKLFKHIREHHAWLVQGPRKATFSQMTGAAITKPDVTALTRVPAFRGIIDETATEETENLLELLEKRLNTPNKEMLVLYSLEEIEDQILGSVKPGKPQSEYLLLADTYLSRSRQRHRVQRLMQIAANKGIKARIVSADSPAGKRLMQLGGMVCILRLN